MEDERIDRIVQLDIEVEGLTDEELEAFGVEIVSLVEEPAIGENFQYFSSDEDVVLDLDDACQPGYKAIGLKPKGGRMVPNCVPIENAELEKYDTKEEAEAAAKLLGCEGAHQMPDGSWMPCEQHFEFESYTDYPQAATNNAKRALKWAEENGWGSCGTAVGKRRANQLAKRQPISEETIARMSAFRRQQQNKNTPYGEGCGGLMWDAWGGDAGIDWAERKLKQIRKERDEASYHTGSMSEEYFTEAAESAILHYAIHNGTQLGEDDVVVDLNTKEFATITSTIDAIRGLDLLRRLKTPEQDPETYWRYSGPPAERKFCKAMVNLSRGGKIFSEKDINKMDGLNKEFSRKGSSSYSIFKFKGGKNCKHRWEKLQVFTNENGNKIVLATAPTKLKEKKAVTPWAEMNHQFNIDNDKRIVTGPLMIPNKMIYRRDADGDGYYIFFTKATIRKMMEKFLRNNKHNNTDIQHDNNVTTENTLLESWISEDKMYDKSYKYGFALPIGTWFVSYKINDEATWNKVKSGDLKGFSLAGPFIEKMAKSQEYNTQLSNIIDILNQVEE